jgi:hypothetical protein
MRTRTHWWRKPNPVFTIATSKSGVFTKAKNLQAGVDRFGWLWKDGVESAAHSYELIRRHTKVTLPPFPELTKDEILFLKHLFPRGEIVWVYEHGGNICEFKAGHSIPTRWNLALPMHTLVTQFKQFIADSKQAQKITTSRCRASKGPSWALVEVLDGSFDCFDPDRLERKAKSMAASCYRKLLGELNESHRKACPNLTRLLSK